MPEMGITDHAVEQFIRRIMPSAGITEALRILERAALTAKNERFRTSLEQPVWSIETPPAWLVTKTDPDGSIAVVTVLPVGGGRRPHRMRDEDEGDVVAAFARAQTAREEQAAAVTRAKAARESEDVEVRRAYWLARASPKQQAEQAAAKARREARATAHRAKTEADQAASKARKAARAAAHEERMSAEKAACKPPA